MGMHTASVDASSLVQTPASPYFDVTLISTAKAG